VRRMTMVGVACLALMAGCTDGAPGGGAAKEKTDLHELIFESPRQELQYLEGLDNPTPKQIERRDALRKLERR
jgi:hypothetical protein